MAKKGTKLYTNGVEERYFSKEDKIPEGFTLCNIIYINDGVNNKRWYDGKPLPEGYVVGKLPLSRNWSEEQHKHHSAETKQKISKSRKAQDNDWWIGRKHRDESKEKIRQSRLGKTPYNKGIKLSEEQKHLRDQKIIKNYGSLKNFYDSKNEKRRNTCIEKYGVLNYSMTSECKNKVSNTVQEKYGCEWSCMRKEARVLTNDSSPNRKFANLLESYNIAYEREYSLGSYSYDFKVNNTLIEINPSATHNVNYGIFGTDGVNYNYHKNKKQYAIDNGFNCIMIWDWDNAEKVIDLFNPNKKRIYARNCTFKLIQDYNLINSFLNQNHLQGTCNSQTVCAGLFYEDELIQLITFGKPRYNKNYDLELLRLCTKIGYIVIGGAKKLFKHALQNNTYNNIISYCDYSKFSGNVYLDLGFSLKQLNNPSKHWFNMKTKQHITDNLLRQRGFDQLFKTNYGKGTSNEQLMLDNGFVEIYDCGQMTYIFKTE